MDFKRLKLLLLLVINVVLLTNVVVIPVVAQELSQSRQLKNAILERKSGNYTQAIDILSQLRKKYVKHKRINIELALNYIKLQQYDNAEYVVQHLQSLLLSQREAQTLEKLKQLLARKMRKSLSSHSFTVDLGFAVGVEIVSNRFPALVYDDFQNTDQFFDDEESIDDSFDDPFIEGEFEYEFTDYELIEYAFEYEIEEYAELGDFWNKEDITEESEVSYTREYLNINYRFRPEGQFELFSHATQWIIENDLSIDYRHLNQPANNNYMSVEWSSSLYVVQLNRWLLEINALASAYDNESKRVLDKFAVRLALTIPVQQFKLKFAIDKQHKSYRSTLSEYDANITIPWGELSYQLSSQIRLVSGVRLRKLKARDEFHSYENRDVFAGIYYYPLTSLSTYFTYHRHNLQYDIDDPEVVNWAKEKKQSFAFGAKYQINQSFSVGINASVGNKTVEMDFGKDDWRRVEASIVYRF